jgi:putative inorganic carbon (HCO3(-)) transporter
MINPQRALSRVLSVLVKMLIEIRRVTAVIFENAAANRRLPLAGISSEAHCRRTNSDGAILVPNNSTGTRWFHFYERRSRPGRCPMEQFLKAEDYNAKGKGAVTPAVSLTTARNQTLLASAATAAAVLAWYFSPQPYVPLLAAIVIVAIVAAMTRPFVVCLAFIVFSFFRLHEAYPFLYPLHLPFLLAVITTGALIWHVLISRTVEFAWPPELRYFAGFFVLVTCGLLFAFNRQVASDFWLDVFSKIGLMTLAIAWLPRTQDDFALAGRIFVVSGILVAVVAIYNKFNGIDLVELTRVAIGRSLNSLLGDPNDLALVLLFPLSFSAGFLFHRSGTFNRLLGLTGLVTILAALIFTQSRGGLIGICAVFSVAAFRVTRSKILVVVLAVAAAYLLYDAMGKSGRVSGGAGGPELDESAADRLNAWGAAIHMAIARPLTGVGLANFADSIYAFADEDPGRAMTAHSTWFGVLGDTGFPGLIAFIAMIAASMRSNFRSYFFLLRANAPGIIQACSFGLAAGLVGFCAAGSFLTQGFGWSVYLLVGLGAALNRYVTQHNS